MRTKISVRIGPTSKAAAFKQMPPIGTLIVMEE
jgi:hypothetical protein